jgi:hypothetical protein
MSKTTFGKVSSGKLTYSLVPARVANGTFSDVRLANGVTIRRVNEEVHRKGLAAASKAFREKA